MFDAKVVTSYTNGTMIQMDANDALNFLVGLSINIITTIGDTIEEKDKFGRVFTKSCNPDVMSLIRTYSSGIPEAVYSCILQTNATILLKFVQDVVLNETTKGLYLLYHSLSYETCKAPYDLVVKALEDVHQYYMEHGNNEYKRDKNKHFNRYNEEFMSLINK